MCFLRGMQRGGAVKWSGSLCSCDLTRRAGEGPTKSCLPTRAAALGVCATRTSATEWPLRDVRDGQRRRRLIIASALVFAGVPARLKPSDGGGTYETYSSLSLSLFLLHHGWWERWKQERPLYWENNTLHCMNCLGNNMQSEERVRIDKLLDQNSINYNYYNSFL